MSSFFHVHDNYFYFNGHTVVTKEALIGDTLSVPVHTGFIYMTAASDTLVVADSLFFANSSGMSQLQDGAIVLSGNFRQNGAPFTPWSVHKTVFAGTSSKVNFASPLTNWFQDVDIKSGSEMFLQTDALVMGTLAHGAGAGTAKVSTTSAGTTYTLVVAGLNQTGSNAMNFQNAALKFADGTTNATFDNVTWTGFPALFAGSLFTVNRSDATMLTFNTHSFSSAGFSASTMAHFLNNAGSANVTMSGANPSGGVIGMHYINSSTGIVTWP